MKILLINNGYPSSTNPQYSTYITSIEQCLRDADMTVDLLVLDTNFKGKVSKYLSYLKFFVKLLIYRYKKYDFIYINNYPYCFFPLMFRIKKFKNIFIHWHGTDVIPPSKRKSILNRLSYRFLPKKHIAIVPSNFFATKVSEKIGVQRLSSIFISPSGGVDTVKFPNLKNEKTDSITLGFASSLTSAKGADLIKKIGRNLSQLSHYCNVDIKLKLIAYGAEKNYYVNALKSSHNVTIELPYSKEKMINFYHTIDVLLFPTRRMAESLGLVGLEAMACGKPVVGTNDFALKEYIIPGETGELFELGNYQDFERAVIRTIKNLGNYTPRELVLEKYSKGAVVQQYKEIFNASVSNKNIEKSVHWIANNGLCSGCGTCQPVCPVNCIEIRLQKDGQYRPEIDSDVCTNCGICTKVCPFSSLTYKKAIAEPIAVYSGYSNNYDVRHDGASGGLVTQLLIDGLKSGAFDAVVVVTGSSLNNFRSAILTNPEEVISAKGSKYVQVPVNVLLKELEDTSFQKIAYVGLPCHIRSLKKYLEVRKKFSARIALMLSLVCGQTLKWSAIEKQLKSLKVKKDELKKYTFRGKGWPGSQKIESNQKQIEIPYTSKLAMGGLFSSTLSGIDACLFCDDHFGKDADISFCDAWHSPEKGRCDGISTALCYSERGQKFLKEEISNNNISIKKDSFENVLKVQGHMKPTGSVLFLLKQKNICNKIKLNSEINSNIYSKVAGLLYSFSQKILLLVPINYYPVSFLAITRGFKKFLKF